MTWASTILPSWEETWKIRRTNANTNNKNIVNSVSLFNDSATMNNNLSEYTGINKISSKLCQIKHNFT